MLNVNEANAVSWHMALRHIVTLPASSSCIFSARATRLKELSHWLLLNRAHWLPDPQDLVS
jgi:hypothetical protein